MPVASRSRRRQRGVAIIWYSLMLCTLLLPIMGIAVDLTMLYTVQAKLSAAVDGAALGGGRLLGTRTGGNAAATEHMAAEFVTANFPTGYWSTPALASAGETVNNSSANTYGVLQTSPAPGSFRIQVAANVRVPLIFARIFNVSNAAVAANAVATRRSNRFIYVLDRSGSMGTLWAALAANAIRYINYASPGVDELGLVLFGTTGVVAYPNYSKPYVGYTAGSWTNPVAGGGVLPATGGPDTGFIDTVGDPKRDGSTAGCTDMLCMVYQAVSGGATGMSEGLDLAYAELQKAHLRDYAAELSDVRTNTVIFFTDGVPNQIAVYANDPNVRNTVNSTATWFKPACTDTWGASNTKCKTKWSTYPTQCADCTNCSKATTFSGSTEDRMLFLAGPGQSAGAGGWSGPYQPADTDINSPTLNWVKETNTNGSSAAPGQWSRASALYQPGSTVAQCQAQVGSSASTATPWNALVQIPKYDYYGTLTYPRDASQDATTPGYYNTALDASVLPKNAWQYTGNYVTQSTPNYWGIAAWSATDNIGYLMRTDSNQSGRGDGSDVHDTDKHMAITIYTIGYTGNTGVDDHLLRRLANDPTAPGYVSDGTQTIGKYYAASDAAGIGTAMGEIMSSVLRLAQ